MDAVAGVIALARRRELPPALLGNEIASISTDLDGAVRGAHLQIDRDGCWVAVAPLDDETVLAFSAQGAGRPGPSRGGGLAQERIVVTGTEPAAVLVVSLHRSVGPAAVAAVKEAAQAVCSRPPSDVSALLDSFAAELHATETDDCVRAALAAVLPGAPLRRSRTRVLPARPAAAPMARRFAVAALPAVVRVDAVRAIELITDELVANAIRFADDTVTLTITDEPTGTLVEVSDTDSRMPIRLVADGQVETGRGLLLVDALADETGVTLDPDGRGKTVWARVAWRWVQS
jgi:anti-sigma regulatory factor (Ser/Thr protein kinase)